MKYQTSERCSSAQSERLKRLFIGEAPVCELDGLALGQAVHAGGDDARAGREAVHDAERTIRPVRQSLTSRVDTVLAAGSTTQTIVLPSRSSRAEAGSSIPGEACVVTAAVIVVPRRKLSGGSSRAILTRSVRVDGSACGAISRTVPVARTEGSTCRATSKRAPGLRSRPMLSGRSTTASRMSGRATVMTVWPGWTTWPSFRLDGGDHAVEVGAKLGIAELLLGLVEIRLGAA